LKINFILKGLIIRLQIFLYFPKHVFGHRSWKSKPIPTAIFHQPWLLRKQIPLSKPIFLSHITFSETTGLGYFTNPDYFLIHRDMPVVINFRENDATLGRNIPAQKHYLEAGFEYPSKWKVDFAYRTLPGFEELVIESLSKE